MMCGEGRFLFACRPGLRLPLYLLLLMCLLLSNSSASLLDLARGNSGRNEGGNGADSAVARCSFLTGAGGPQRAPLSSFFVPASDRAMYEEGLKDYLQQIGAQPSDLSVVCTPHISAEPVTCQLCLYNEVSRDLKHVRQGQVLSSLLPQCMQGAFEQAFRMPMSQYHPICYPDERNNDNNNLEQHQQQQQIGPHASDGSCSNSS